MGSFGESLAQITITVFSVAMSFTLNLRGESYDEGFQKMSIQSL